MRTKYLALRIALNSVLMILAVYLFMQTLTFFRDNILFGLTGIAELPSAVGAFIGTYVIPPSLVFGIIIYLMALPLQKMQMHLEAGGTITPAEAEKTRLKILRFSGPILAFNLIGFAAGYVLLMILSGRTKGLFESSGLIVLFANLTGGTIYAAAQTALNNKVFSPLREMLSFREIGERKKENRSTVKQFILTAFLILYALFFTQFNISDAFSVHAVETDTLRMYASGEISKAELGPTYRAILKERRANFSNRTILDVDTVPLPWERSIAPAEIQRRVFYLCFIFILSMTLFVQLISSVVLRAQLEILKNRIREVLTGGKDLRQRLNLQTMDEIGELTELINRMLDQFHSIVSRIASAAEETHKGAADIDRVLTESERLSRETGQAVLALGSKLENQTAETRKLKTILDSFKQAVMSVATAAETQNQFAAETSSAMEEMSSNIQSVASMTDRSLSLTENLRARGEEGGKTAQESSRAISDIAESAAGVLEVIKALDKIAASINLLAMNAAIEAAHAGDKGSGFAVVADEVRQLAETAAKQTKSIKEILKTMSERVRHGVAKSESSVQVLNALIAGIGQAAAISREIANAMKEQSVGTKSVAQNLGKVLEASISIRKRTEEQTGETTQMANAIAMAINNFESLANDSRSRAEGIRKLETSIISTRKEVSNNLGAVKSLTLEVENFKI